MSVQLLPYAHINALITFATGGEGVINIPLDSVLGKELTARGWQPLSPFQVVMSDKDKAALGRVLVKQLALSYLERYGVETAEEVADYIAGYEYAPAGHSLSLLELARGMDSYAYQASCALGWQVSSAKQFLDLARALILRRLMDNDSEATEGWVIEE